MIISVTERGTFRRCKRQWDYASFNRQALTPLVPPTALSLGSLVHRSHEEWLLNPDKEVSDIVMGVAAQGLRELKERYKKVVGVEPDEQELKDFFEQVNLVLEMMNNYRTKWGSSLPDGYTLLQPEQTVLVSIPETPHELEATFDALIQDEGGRLWILERKTYGNRPKVEVLQSNDQFGAYLWALTQLELGPVGGVYYDGMWKRAWEGKRSLDDLFMREPLIRSPEEIINIGQHIRDEAFDMAAPDLRVYPNRAWQGCWDCKFERLCSAQDREEDAEYIRARYFVERDRSDWQEEAD